MGRDLTINLFPFFVSKSFNPRARMGRDMYYNGRIYSLISFNPRARMGRDPKISAAARL